LIAPRHQTEISADVARSPEAPGIVNRGCEGECGELARSHVIILISLHH
jgi:hypothetical protein